MLDKTLREYLEKVRALNQFPPEGEVRQALKVAGWSADEIEESIVFLRAGRPPVPAMRPDSAGPISVSSSNVVASSSLQTKVSSEIRPGPALDIRPASTPVSGQGSAATGVGTAGYSRSGQTANPAISQTKLSVASDSVVPRQPPTDYSPVGFARPENVSGGTLNQNVGASQKPPVVTEPTSGPKFGQISQNFSAPHLSAFQGMPKTESEASLPLQSKVEPRPVASDWPAPKGESSTPAAGNLGGAMTYQGIPSGPSLPPLTRPRVAVPAQAVSTGGRGKWLVITIILTLLIIGGGVAFAYFAKIGPFAQKANESSDPALAINPVDTTSVATTTPVAPVSTTTEISIVAQRDNVGKIRGALNLYKQIVGVYPNSLNDLRSVLSPAGTSTLPEVSYLRDAVGSRPLLNSIPKDVFTGSDFSYATTSGDYRLIYAVQFPEQGQMVTLSDYFVKEGVGVKPKLVAKYVYGANSATSLNLSEEAQASSKLDADKDGVADGLEDLFGTSKAKADSDSDGVSDYDELIKNTNPLGVGNL